MRVCGTTLAVCALLGGAATEAEAARTQQDTRRHATAAPHSHAAKARPSTARHATRHAARRSRGHVAALGGTGSAGISCVPYARSVTGMAIFGNGGEWWSNAAGSYGRGNRPEPGSVMAFRSTGGMSRGHVAVVGRVLNDRQVLIDHANWGGPGIRKGSIMHNVSVVDVSADNDWTAVRVQSGHSDAAYGRTYPTYGFIYNRPARDSAPVYAATRPMQRSLRFEQLAEMPVGSDIAAEPVSYQPQGLAPLRKAAADRPR